MRSQPFSMQEIFVQTEMLCPRPVQRPSLDEQVRQGRMQRYETDFEEQVRRAFPS